MIIITTAQIMKALQLQLNKLGCETQINIEQRYFDRLGYINTKYKVIYWLTKRESEGKKQKIEKEFNKQTDVINELNDKVKEYKLKKGK